MAFAWKGLHAEIFLLCFQSQQLKGKKKFFITNDFVLLMFNVLLKFVLVKLAEN